MLISCNTEKYNPKFKDQWLQIQDTVQQVLHSNKGNCTHFKGCNCIPLPDTFAIVTWCGVQFYWDTYFTQLGLLACNEYELARGGANNLLFLCDTLGYVPNASAKWGLQRSQPPYLGMMVRNLYEYKKDSAWLRRAYKSLLKEYYFWTNSSENAIEKTCTPIDGLQRYSHGRMDSNQLLATYASLKERLSAFGDTSNEAKMTAASHHMAEAESGMDFTTRFEHHCEDFIAVDLNSNLYSYEINLGWMERELKLSDGAVWLELAQKRKLLINQYCWNEKRGMYLDYDFVHKRHSSVAAATSFSPLFVGLATAEHAQKMVNALPLLENEFGVMTTEVTKDPNPYQWDHASIWPPMQCLVMIALDKYGYKKDALRIAEKYLDLVAANFFHPNPSDTKDKKGNSLKRTPFKIYEKYAADGTINNREYNAGEMYGWSTGTFAFAYRYVMSQEKR